MSRTTLSALPLVFAFTATFMARPDCIHGQDAAPQMEAVTAPDDEVPLAEHSTLGPALRILTNPVGSMPALSLTDRLAVSGQQFLRDARTTVSGAVPALSFAGSESSRNGQLSAGTGINSAQGLTPSASASGLAWYSSDYAYCYGQLSSTTRNGYYPLANGSKYGDVLKITGSAYAESRCSLRFDKNYWIEFTTWANPSTTYSSANSQMYTSTSPSSYGYVYFAVLPSSSSDYGRPVTVSLTGNAVRTLKRNDGASRNTFNAYAGSSTWVASQTSYGSSTTTYYFPTRTISTTYGAWVGIAMFSQSYAVNGNSANQKVVINIAVR